MIKRLVAFMSALCKSPVFRRSLKHFTLLAIFAGTFAYLTVIAGIIGTLGAAFGA